MTEQKTLDLPVVNRNKDHIRLATHLMRHQGWTTAREIGQALQMTDRRVRELASNSNGLIVSSPGSPGYKHVYMCTGKEVARIANGLQAQAKLMSERAGQIRAQFHRTATDL